MGKRYTVRTFVGAGYWQNVLPYQECNPITRCLLASIRHNARMAGIRISGRGRPLWLLGALIAALVALWIVQAVRQNPPALSAVVQSTGSGAESYFRKLGAPPGAGPPTVVRHTDQDGMVSDYASGSYRVTLPRAGVLGYYRAACQRLGLTSPASPEALTYYPGAICSGAVIVTVTLRCTGATCTAFVEVTG